MVVELGIKKCPRICLFHDNGGGMRAKISDRAAVVVIIMGSLTAWGLSNRMRSGLRLQDLLAGPLGMMALPILVSATLGAVIYWGWPRQRRPYLWSVLVSGTLSTAMLVYANWAGLLSGTTFRPALWVQCCVYGLAMTGLVALSLGAYRLLARYSKVLALAVYLGWVAIFSALSIPALRALLATGAYVMSHGYTIFWDVLWGILLYLVGLGLYLTLDRRLMPTPGIRTHHHAPPEPTTS